MIRIIVTTADCSAAANVGGPVNVTHKTFDVSAPEVESFLNEKLGTYVHRTVCGVEILQAEQGAK